MNDTMRKRGWSIVSTPTEKNTTPNEITAVFPPRPRANTDHSEDTLTPEQKAELLKFPDVEELEEEEDSRVKVIDCVVKKRNGELMNGGGGNAIVGGAQPDAVVAAHEEADVIDIIDDDYDTNGTNLRPKKKKRLNKEEVIDIQSDGDKSKVETITKESQDLQKLDDRKKKLSKWASRLFDPNRPRGLVETPQIIPQNDEFLKEFGKRELEFATSTGKEIEIDRGNLDEEEEDMHELGSAAKNGVKGKMGGVKVKIANLSYTTNTTTLTIKCESYGPLLEVNLVMDPKAVAINQKLSLGRAYILFETVEGAESCVAGMNEKLLEGRQLRVTRADARRCVPCKGGRAGKGGLARYWEKDITTKCFRCGKVGHMSDQCENVELPRPCIYCAKTGHELWCCPLTKICFKCGVPGHINRECPERRHIPRRLVCGTCFMSGHDRSQCREKIYNIPSYNARCFVCGQTGHFMCKSMQWFFGLTGISCYNCGETGHHAIECKRPKLSDLARNAELALNEIDRAEGKSLEEEFSRQRHECNGSYRDARYRDGSTNRGRERDYDNRMPEYQSSHSHRYNQPSRASSQPPEYSSQNQASQYGRIR